MRRIDTAERRARLMVRHHLASTAPAKTVLEATRGVVALHATDPASVYLSARARVPSATRADIERELYDQRTVVRMLGMRRTLFVVPIDLAPAIDAGCTQAIAARERKQFIRQLEQAGVATDGAAWLRAAEAATLAALEARGQATATELSREVPELRVQVMVNPDKAYGGLQGLSTRVLFLLAADGHIVRTRPRGSLTSTQHEWRPMAGWLPELTARIGTAEAQAELIRRWLRSFGPGTTTDLKWWTGWTVGDVKRALAAVGAVEVGLDGGTGWVLPDDLQATVAPEPSAALLPTLDPTAMGWNERAWYLGPHKHVLFDTNGNIGPSVWWDGRIIGGWAQRADGSVVTRLLEDVGREAREAVDGAATEVQGWLGPVRVRPRFRTPLERELTAG